MKHTKLVLAGRLFALVIGFELEEGTFGNASVELRPSEEAEGR